MGDRVHSGLTASIPVIEAEQSRPTPSARGLFRATGKTSKPVATRLLDGSYAKVDALEREKDDFYPTPPEPIRALLHAEIDRGRASHARPSRIRISVTLRSRCSPSPCRTA